MGRADKQEALDNLLSIRRDAEEIATPGITSDRKSHVQEALHLRMQALHAELEDDQPAHIVDKVSTDVLSLESKIQSSTLGLSPRLKHEAMSNLEEINKDVHKYNVARGAQKQKLKQAIDLRMHALRAELSADKAGAAAVASRVQDDVNSLQSKLAASSLSLEERTVVKSNLAAISKDARLLATADTSKAVKLGKAIHLRMDALKKELHVATAAAAQPSTKSTAKVDKDVRVLEEKVRSSSLSAEDRRDAQANLAAIRLDAAKLVKASSPATKAKIVSALKLREDALRMQLGSVKNTPFKPPVAKAEGRVAKGANVPDDIRKMTKQIEALNLPKHLVKEMEQNLAAISKDTKRYANATPKKKVDLKKAIGFRTKALQRQMAKAQ